MEQITDNDFAENEGGVFTVNGKSGHVYIIQTLLNPYIKIGYTLQSPTKLGGRYCTAFGGEMTIYVFASVSAAIHEKQIHWNLRSSHLSLEIFRLDVLSTALVVAEMVTGSSPIIINYRAKNSGLSEPKQWEIRSNIAAAYKFSFMKKDCKLIIAASEITSGTFEKAIIDYKSTQKHEINKYLAREKYNYTGIIDVEFISDYSRLEILMIFVNIKLCRNDWATSIDRAKEYFGRRNMPNCIFRFEMAAEILCKLGFAGDFGDKIEADAFIISMEKIKPDLMTGYDVINRVFPKNFGLIIKKWSNINVFKYINLIIEDVFGCNIDCVDGHYYVDSGYMRAINIVGDGEM